MKPLPALLACSLAANAALVSVALVRPGWFSQFPSPFGRHDPEPTQAVARSASPAGAPAITPKVWELLSAGDLPSVVQRLRAAGFPPRLLREIVRNLVSEQFKSKTAAIVAANVQTAYWKVQRGPFDMKTQEALSAVSREQEAAVTALLGPAADDNDDPVSQAIIHAQYGNLSPEAVRKINRIQQDYGELSNEVSNNIRGAMLPEDMEKFNYLRQQQAADVMAALTPEEYQTYQLTNGATAQSLRYKLSAFNPTEDEFKAIDGIQSAVDNKYAEGLAPGTSQDEMAQRAAAQAADQKAADAQIAAALGPARYADYQMETDGAFIQTSMLVQRLGLPDGTTAQVYGMQHTFQAQASAIQSDSTLASADKASQLSALYDQATAQLTSLLGPKGFQAYGNNGGWWLNSLKPQKH